MNQLYKRLSNKKLHQLYFSIRQQMKEIEKEIYLRKKKYEDPSPADLEYLYDLFVDHHNRAKSKGMPPTLDILHNEHHIEMGIEEYHDTVIKPLLRVGRIYPPQGGRYHPVKRVKIKEDP